MKIKNIHVLNIYIFSTYILFTIDIDIIYNVNFFLLARL